VPGPTRAMSGPIVPPFHREIVGDQAVAPALRTITGYVWRLAVLAVVVYVTFTVLERPTPVAPSVGVVDWTNGAASTVVNENT